MKNINKDVNSLKQLTPSGNINQISRFCSYALVDTLIVAGGLRILIFVSSVPPHS